MARIRSIKPEFPHSESMGNVSREARLCFILLWTIADDAGRLRGNSRMLASLLYPYDNDAPKLIDKWLTDLEANGCVVRYSADGQSYIQICNWLNHQRIDKPTASKIPSFQEDSRGFAKGREDSYGEGIGREGNGIGKEGNGTPDGDVSAKKPSKPKKRPMPADFAITQQVRDWAAKNGYSSLDRHYEYFVNLAKAKGYEYADWDAAFRNAIAGDWAKIPAVVKPVDSWAGRDI
jgi:hypothetical protein